MKALGRIEAAGLLLLMIHAGAAAQTMRFETNVGSFDMVLNPTNDANLQPLVDNLVAYIGLGRYHYTAINRAVDGIPGPNDTDDDFVLQMGGFLGFPPTPNDFLGLVQPVKALSPVTTDFNGDGQVDFSTLQNTRGTVSMALRSGQPNSGTSSFFINLNDNSDLLDSQGFVPFARIADMTTIDKIMLLTQTDLDGPADNVTFDDVPLTDNGRLVILKSVHVLQAAPNFSFVGPISSALANQPVEDEIAQAVLLPEGDSEADFSSSADGGSAAMDLSAAAPSAGAAQGVPEPAAGLLAVFAALSGGMMRRRRVGPGENGCVVLRDDC